MPPCKPPADIAIDLRAWLDGAPPTPRLRAWARHVLVTEVSGLHDDATGLIYGEIDGVGFLFADILFDSDA